MRVFSSFAGIGGFEIGIQNAYHTAFVRMERGEGGGVQRFFSGNMQPNGTEFPSYVGYSEIDKYAIKIYERHFPGVKNYGDITTIDTDGLPEFDCFVGGFPCQAFSIAGKRKGFEDTRGTLFFDIARILQAKRPALFVLENVKGLLSHDNGNTFKIIISTLAELGYHVQWDLLNSKHFGVPQNRERVFIVGNTGRKPLGKVFPIGTCNEKDTRVVGEDVAYCIDANYVKGTHDLGKSVRSLVKASSPGDVRAVLTPEREEKRQHGRRMKNCGEPMFTLTSQDVHGIAVGTWRTHKNGEGFREVKFGVAPTIPARAREDGSGQPVMAEGARIRRLTPVECERFQGFPDNWTEGISDTQRYKTLGNAVTTNVVQAVFERILMSLRGFDMDEYECWEPKEVEV